MTSPCFRGPDVAVVGWIPFFDRIKDLPAGHNYQASLATHLLFNSGNAEPPDEFTGGYNEFLGWLGSRQDYRGALYIRDVILRYDADKPAPIISFQAQGIMGYTPPRLRIGGITLTPPGRLARLKGVSPNDYPAPDVEPLPLHRGIKILFTYQFKLSPIMDKLQRAITGRWAPNAWAAIEYEIRSTGRVRIAVTGTAIPSQDVYVNWKRVEGLRFDMLQSSSWNIQGFMINTPGCSDAPPVNDHFWDESASECDRISTSEKGEE
jgi:hypothetical protein